ncbi:MAG TPA: GNVR domain-containing protein [bacterium]|nr:GNVR domain-containing protein [bacterium]HPR88702.1 GNVR domain-containing protein [bacterium]
MALGTNTRDWQIWRQLIWRRRYYVIFSCALALIAGLVYALKTTPVFESSATVMIIDTELLSSAQLRFVPGAPHYDEVEFFRRRITSEGFLLSILDSLDIQQDPKLRAKINQFSAENPQIDRVVIAHQVYIEYLLAHISTRMRAYNLIEISGRGPTSDSAHRLAALVTHMAIAETQRSQIQTTSAASNFSSQQLEIYRKRLDDSESRLAAFNQGVTDAVLSENQVSESNLAEIQSVKLSTEIDLQSKRDQMGKLIRGTLHDLPLTYQAQLDRDTQELRQRMLKRTGDVCELLKKFGWRDVEIILLNEEIGQLKQELYTQLKSHVVAALSAQPQNIIDGAVRLEEIRLDITMLERTDEILASIIQTHHNMVRRRPSQDGMRAKLERDVTINREIYEMLLQTSRGSQIRESAQVKESQMKFKLLSEPQRPLERIKPKRKQAMIFALMGGLGLGLGLVLLREVLDVTMRTTEDIERILMMPVLAAIPKIESTIDVTRRKQRRIAVAVGLPLLALVSVMLIYRILLR